MKKKHFIMVRFIKIVSLKDSHKTIFTPKSTHVKPCRIISNSSLTGALFFFSLRIQIFVSVKSMIAAGNLTPINPLLVSET